MLLKTGRVATAGVAVMLTLTGCTSEPNKRASPPPAPSFTSSAFTQDTAEAVLREVAFGISKSGVVDFCAQFARSTQTCDTLLKNALGRCLLPGNRPTVKQAVHLPAADGYEESWQLKVQGRTLDGQDYISDFLVVQTKNGAPKAQLGIYWTGQGQGRNMDTPTPDTLTPKNACPK